MRDFGEATRAARARLDAEELTVAEHERVRNAIGERTGGSWRLRLAVSCAAAALAVVVVLVVVGRDTDGFVAVGAGASCVTSVAHGVEVAGTCASTPHLAMSGDDAEAELTAGSVLVREQSALRLRRGRATFAVNKRKNRQARFVVRVSAGAVVVTGTRFTVVENGQSGSVAVSEGTVEFRWADGAATPVHAGETLAWPRVETPPVPPAQADEDDATGDAGDVTPPGRRATTNAPGDAGAVLRRLLQLRTQNRFDEAIALLRAATRDRSYTRVQRERFGFELCNLVTQTQSTPQACACWRRHMRSFPDSGRVEHLPEALHECR